jgi:murein DD-endopeptidase MepM/ murein hydrolase activator NlpD
MSQIIFDSLPHEICRVTSPFGYRTNPITGSKGTFHQGLDIGAKRAGVSGDPLYAVKDGRVVWADSMMNPEYGYGHYIIIQHQNFLTLYAHMLSLIKKVGDVVKAGDVIGYMGSTGASTAAHLHFEVQPGLWTGYANYIKKENGIRKYNIDPYQFIQEYRQRKKEDEELANEIVRYKNISEMPVYYQTEIKDLVDRGIIKGNDKGELNMTEDMVRTIIIAKRMDKSAK